MIKIIFPFSCLSQATWHDAFNHCKANGTQLVSVANRTDYHHLQTFIAKRLNCTEKFAMWIGANDLATKGTFTWVDTGRRVQFTNWKPKKKLDNVRKAREEHCIEVLYYLKRNYRWHWRKSECRRKRFYVCEKVHT